MFWLKHIIIVFLMNGFGFASRKLVVYDLYTVQESVFSVLCFPPSGSSSQEDVHENKHITFRCGLANQDGTCPAIWGRKCLCVCRYPGFLKWKKGLEKSGIRKLDNLVNTLMELFSLGMRSVWGVNWGTLFRCGLQALTVTLLTGLVWVMISNVWLLPLHSHCPIKGSNKCLLTKSTRNPDIYKY